MDGRDGNFGGGITQSRKFLKFDQNKQVVILIFSWKILPIKKQQDMNLARTPANRNSWEPEVHYIRYFSGIFLFLCYSISIRFD